MSRQSSEPPTALSRVPSGEAPPRAEPASAAAPDWCGRHLALGLGLGLTLGLGGQLAVRLLAPGEHDATPGLRLAAVAYSTAAWVALGLLVAAAGLPLLRWRAGRVAALALSATSLAAAALAEVLGLALRTLSGVYLTSGAVAFSFGSSDHFLHAAAGRYRGIAAAIVLTATALWLLVAWILRPALRARGRPWPPVRLAALGLGLSAMLIGVYLGRNGWRFTRRMFASGPVVALLSSGTDKSDFELTRTLSRPEAIGAPLAPLGAPLSAGPAWLAAARAARGPRPNVLLMQLESLSPAHLHFMGYRRQTSPNLDRLARDGLVMTRAWATATHSNYSQMAVLSSLFPRRGNGLDQYNRLDYPRVLLHDLMHGLGYATATISSQDETWQGMLRFQTTGTPTTYWYAADYHGPKLDSGTEKDVPDAFTTDVVLDWLSRAPLDRPWSLYVNFQAPHFPYLIPPDAARPWVPADPDPATFNYLRYPESERQAAINRYDDAIRYLDEQVGRIYRYLGRTGELDATVWIFTADHGEAFHDKGHVTHGKSLYDFEARVPLVVHWPAAIAPARRDEPVSHLDILPTLVELLGLPPHPAFQGHGFRRPAPASVGKRAVFMNIQGLRFADAVVCWPYKLILDRTAGRQMLFDLAADPREERDLSARRPEVLRRLADTLNLQLLAQLDYHRKGAEIRRQRYQPRLRSCPELP